MEEWFMEQVAEKGGVHTNGPWYAESGNHEHFSIFSRDGVVLARLYDKRGSYPQAQMAGHQYLYDGQAVANAQLFAAAPELLEIARQAERDLTAKLAMCAGGDEIQVAAITKKLEAARAAIAKATGQ